MTAVEINAGALVRDSIAAARDHLGSEVIILKDPRDGTEAPAILGCDVQPIDPSLINLYRQTPLRRTGTATHSRLDSFIAHVNRFKGENSVVFAQDVAASPSLTAVYDYHHPGYDGKPENLSHTAVYNFPLSTEWKAWTSANGQAMPMGEFAAFLEDHIVDVIEGEPQSDAAKNFLAKSGGNLATPSKLMEIARGLQVNEASTLRQARNLSSGEAEVVFSSEHRDANGGKLILPNAFMICIPVFAHSQVFDQMLARFRYRKSGEGIVFWFDLWRSDLVFENAFSDVAQKVAAETELPVFSGVPEF